MQTASIDAQENLAQLQSAEITYFAAKYSLLQSAPSSAVASQNQHKGFRYQTKPMETWTSRVSLQSTPKGQSPIWRVEQQTAYESDESCSLPLTCFQFDEKLNKFAFI